MNDLKYMDQAITLAEKGRGFVNPNPLVGAVIVRDGRVIGEGWHERYGGLHAERNALKNCTEDARGATMYVTLEPCCHYGKTPPCTEAVIAAGIRKVVIGMTDPNPLVAGKGIGKLKKAGIEVVCGVREDKVRDQNRIFLKYITRGTPWVVMKTAMTLDGKIASYTGDSKWITGEEARCRVHELRGRYMAIMAGIGTVLADDPLLNCRLEGEVRQPVRIVVDSAARLPLETQLVRTACKYRTVVACTDRAGEENVKVLKNAGIEIWNCKEKEGEVDVQDLLEQMGKVGIDSVLLEGGGTLNGTFISNKLVDEVCAYIAPKIIGGKGAQTPVGGKGIAQMEEAIELTRIQVEMIGKDILICGRFENK